MSEWLAVDLRQNPPVVTPDRDFEASTWLDAYRKGQFATMWKLLVRTA